MQSYTKVSKEYVELGVPLEKSLYDKNGLLLIKAGGTIDSERHLSILFEKEIFCFGEGDEDSWLTPQIDDKRNNNEAFVAMDNAKTKLKHVFDHFRAGKAQEEFLPRVKAIAISLQEACELDKDAALANLHLDHGTPYAVIHHLQAATLCEIVGKRLGVNDAARLKLVKAALTHDIDLLDIQHVLDVYTLPLSHQHSERVRNHPKASAAILRELGVTDMNWLDAVEHHHERLDGSGYGDGLSGEAIKIPTRILAIADIYSAMIRDRPNRKAIISKEALRKLMLEFGGKSDVRLTHILIKEVGVFPPGAIVPLANDEIAVVKEQADNSAFPVVYAFIDSSGAAVPTPEKRYTVDPGNKINSVVPFANYRDSINTIRSVWTSVPA